MPIPEEDDATDLELAREALVEDLDTLDAEGAADCLAEADCVSDAIEYAIELQEALAELTQKNEAFLSLARRELAESTVKEAGMLS